MKGVIQKDGMDDSLRNKLWSLTVIYFWKPYESAGSHSNSKRYIQALLTQLWMLYFEKPIDAISAYWPDNLAVIREHFFLCYWSRVYDFIEFVAQHYGDGYVASQFINHCNLVLEQELSAYRFVDGEITPITSEQEIEAVKQAVQSSSPSPVVVHLKTALGLFSDRENPDYRNSIKESISAVEALCVSISGQPKASLGQALDVIEDSKQVELHRALKAAFDKLYGYTSDSNGIRHAMLEKPNVDSEDAKFMLVACSAFVNYLVEKSTKAGIKLQFPN